MEYQYVSIGCRGSGFAAGSKYIKAESSCRIITSGAYNTIGNGNVGLAFGQVYGYRAYAIGNTCSGGGYDNVKINTCRHIYKRCGSAEGKVAKEQVAIYKNVYFFHSGIGRVVNNLDTGILGENNATKRQEKQTKKKGE